MSNRITIFFFLLYVSATLKAQEKNTSKSADAVIVYDRDADSKPIPFDKKTVFHIIKFQSAGVKQVFLFEACYVNGDRRLKEDLPKLSIADVEVGFKIGKDTLTCFLPQLKPGIEFDIAIVRQLTGANLAMIYKVNEAIYNNDPKTAVYFKALIDGTDDITFKRTYFQYQSLAAYQSFFSTNLYPYYADLHNPVNLRRTAFPGLTEWQLLQTGFTVKKIPFSDNDRMLHILADGGQVELQEGIITVKYDHLTEKTKEENYEERITNLRSSITFFDSLSRKMNNLILEGYDPSATISALKKKIDELTAALTYNLGYIKEKWSKINKELENNDRIRENEWLVGSTEARDIKTKGGNFFTLDAGFANIVTKNIKSDYIYFPKLYTGLNIYFRPVDKNSRVKNFPKKYKPDYTNGPDYNIAAVNNIWHHLSLTIGLTFGSMGNSQFDVLYNNAALLVGPGYRLGRFLKINGGLALMKRSSKNPLVSEKKVIGGSFLSLSMDIDIIQGLKDFTSMIFK